MKAHPKAKRILFSDLAAVTIRSCARAGFSWQDLVGGFGDGSGTGLPPVDSFSDLAVNTTDWELRDQPEAELRRIMRSRLYRRHRTDDSYDDDMERSQLIGLAVWNYLYDRMEREYVEVEGPEDEDEEEPQQLTLPLNFPIPTGGGHKKGGAARQTRSTQKGTNMDHKKTTASSEALLSRFEEALVFAAQRHREQRRKGTDIPYISHLMQVAGLALENGADEDAAIAALLHDATEDQDVTGEELTRRFGPTVAAIVAGCSALLGPYTLLTLSTVDLHQASVDVDDFLRPVYHHLTVPPRATRQRPEVVVRGQPDLVDPVPTDDAGVGVPVGLGLGRDRVDRGRPVDGNTSPLFQGGQERMHVPHLESHPDLPAEAGHPRHLQVVGPGRGRHPEDPTEHEARRLVP